MVRISGSFYWIADGDCLPWKIYNACHDEHKNQRKILQTGVFLGAIVFVVSFYGFFNAPELNHEWLILSYKYSDYFGLAAGGLIILYYGSLLVTYTPPSSPAPPSHHFSGGKLGFTRKLKDNYEVVVL
jgi:hypothetical protein